MKTRLDQDQIAQYRSDGFTIIRQLLASAEVTELRGAVLEAIATMGRRRIAGEGANLVDGDAYFDRVYTQRLNLWQISEVVRRYLHAPELGEMLCRLEGINAIRVWHDQALIKEPFGNPTNLHVDNPYWSFYSPHAATIWIALEDATPENGCLCFLPGSHRIAEKANVGPSEEFGSLLKLYPAMREIRPVVAAMKAGDCSIHNGLTAHGAGVNMTTDRRIAMTCAYMPDGSTFNGIQNVLPDDYFGTLQLGDVLDREHFNPLVAKLA
ncbi:MAG: phytanoyl-CoA dioxygenase family protein [Pseudomonadota bacterium]